LTLNPTSLIVRLMKWLLILALAALGCGDEAPNTFPAGGTVPLAKIPETGGSGGGGGDGLGGAGGFEPRGACDNASDLGAIESASDSVRNIASDCGSLVNISSCASLILNAPEYEECITDCVEEDVPGVSAECASCYGALERCGLQQIPSCRVSCQNNTCSDLCLNCLTDEGCIEDYEDCRGLPGNGCPG
jgi:hypothetical protein